MNAIQVAHNEKVTSDMVSYNSYPNINVSRVFLSSNEDSPLTSSGNFAD